MTETTVSPDAALSVDSLLRLDAICERFERAWLAGRRPALEQFLAGSAGDERTSLLHELLQLDLDYRRRLGEDPPPGEYEDQFPNDVALVRAAFAAHSARSTVAAPRRPQPAGGSATDPDDPRPQALTTPETTEAQPRSSSGGRWRDARVPQLPGYEVLEELGRGGMGVVYKARQTALKRLAALKMILAGDYAAAEEVARFRTEAEAIARLCHPHIVQVYEVGEHDGRPYFSMEYVDGGNLAARLRESLPEPREAARLIETLARAVHAMHGCRVVHRDLKPANVLLTADGTPKISDFGLAKKLDEDSGQTRPGVVMGTPAYMAPEQADGRGADVGPRTDVYALGAVLYECLTGRPPFRAATRQETLRQVIGRDAIAPRRLNPAVPRDLETIALKCLQKDAGRRYASALELADDLRRCLEGRTIRARAAGSSERAIKWARSRPTHAALAAAVVVAFLCGLSGVTYYALYKGSEADLLAREARLRKDIDTFLVAATDAERDGHFAEAREQLGKALALLDARPGSADGELRRQLQTRRDLADRRVKEDQARQDFAERVARFEERRRAAQHHTISFSDRDPEPARAVARREAAAGLAELGFSPDDTPAEAGRRLEAFRGSPAAAEKIDGLAAECYEVLLAWADAEAPPEKALRLLDMAAAVAAAHHVAAPQAFSLRRARLLATLGRHEEADAARAVVEKVAATAPLDLFLAGLEAYRQGQLARAAAACERVLHEEPRHFWARYLLALCRLGAGEWDRAKDGLTACLGERPDFFWPRLFRATAEGGLRDFDAAEDDFTAVAPLVGDDPLGRWLLHANRGALRVQEARWDDAINDLKEAVSLRPGAVEAYVTLAQAHAGRGDFAAAVAVLGEALRQRPDDPELYHTRAQMQLRCGDVKSARADFEQAIRHARRTGSITRLVAAVLSPAAPAPAHDPRSRAALRLASDYVQLAHLQHEGKDYVAALVSCAAALFVWPDYLPAHYQRAETLQAVKHYAGAGAALDRYLRRAVPTAEVYQARGLIHAQLHEYQKAAEAYDRATALRPDARTLAYCGWAYLKLDAPRPALEKFEDALKRDRTNADALCGRGLIRAWRGDVRGAAADAEAVRRLHPHDADWLLQAACVYAQAAPRAATAEAGAAYGNRAVALLDEVMSQLPADRRAAFWRGRVEPEKELTPVRRSRAFLELARTYGGS